MAGITKLVDDRIEQLRRDRIELDALRETLTAREAALEQLESAPSEIAAPSEAPLQDASPPDSPDLMRMRAALFTELAALEQKKADLIDDLVALEEDCANRKIEITQEISQIKITKMKELEQEIEAYREACFVNLQADLVRQRKLLAVQPPAHDASEPPPPSVSKKRRRTRNAKPNERKAKAIERKLKAKEREFGLDLPAL